MTYPQPHPPGNHYPPPVPAKTNQKLIIVLAAVGVVVLMCVGCGIVGAIASLGTDDPPQAASTTPAIVAPATQVPEDTTPPPAPSPTPTTPTTPPVVAVPNLVGQNAAVAADRLEKLGFTNIDYGSEDADDTIVINRANWTVTKQSTKAGEKVPTDTLIVLTCTKDN